MKYLILFLPAIIMAKSYMGIVEPFEKYTIYAKTSGEVLKINNNDEMKQVEKTIIKLDDKLELEKLKLYKEQLRLKQQRLQINQNNYKKFIKIKGKSKVEKDNKLETIINLKSDIVSLKVQIEELKNTIKNKTITIKDLYIKEFLVNKYDYVNTSTKLLNAYDISKSKVTIYVNQNDYKNIQNKKIYINDKKTDFKIYKQDITTDKTYVSSYKVEILIDSKEFGSPIKVEFKNE